MVDYLSKNRCLIKYAIEKKSFAYCWKVSKTYDGILSKTQTQIKYLAFAAYQFSDEEISCTLLWQPFSSMQELSLRILQSLKTDHVWPTFCSSLDWSLNHPWWECNSQISLRILLINVARKITTSFVSISFLPNRRKWKWKYKHCYLAQFAAKMTKGCVKMHTIFFRC